jgi:hypothetical protein
VRTHNEVSHIEDIDNLFTKHPDVFTGKAPNVTTAKPVKISRPLQLRR